MNATGYKFCTENTSSHWYNLLYKPMLSLSVDYKLPETHVESDGTAVTSDIIFSWHVSTDWHWFAYLFPWAMLEMTKEINLTNCECCVLILGWGKMEWMGNCLSFWCSKLLNGWNVLWVKKSLCFICRKFNKRVYMFIMWEDVGSNFLVSVMEKFQNHVQ